LQIKYTKLCLDSFRFDTSIVQCLGGLLFTGRCLVDHYEVTKTKTDVKIGYELSA